MKRFRFPSLLIILCLVMSAPAASAMEITITNLTNGIYFGPLLVTAHATSVSLFKTGQTASSALETLAETGDISDLSVSVGGADADTIEDPANGYLAPGAAVTFTLTPLGNNDALSCVARLSPTNDGFVGLDSLGIPTESGSYYLYFNAYDAGTEANNELIASNGDTVDVLGIADDPGNRAGDNGTGVTSVEPNTKIHIHRGVLGDTDPDGGVSDLDSSVHRWLNPVARMDISIP